MAKRLEKWLDEFVENGADAEQVTEWPDNAGGAETHFPAYDETKTWYFYPRELLKYLIKSGVDVDAEIPSYELSYVYVSFGLVYQFADTGASTGFATILPRSNDVEIRVLGNTQASYIQTPGTYTFRTMLEALSEKVTIVIETSDDIVFVGQLYVKTGSTQIQKYDLVSGDDFFSFFKYEA